MPDRVRLYVDVNVDPTGYGAMSRSQVVGDVQRMLDDRISHYKPVVSMRGGFTLVEYCAAIGVMYYPRSGTVRLVHTGEIPAGMTRGEWAMSLLQSRRPELWEDAKGSSVDTALDPNALSTLISWLKKRW